MDHNIVVIKPSGDFEQIPGKIIREYDALTIGVYAKLVSLSDGWKMSIKGLAKAFALSEDKIRKSIGMLEVGGWIVRKPIHKDGLLHGWVYMVLGNAAPEESRSRAGISVSQNQTTLISDNTENGEHLNNILQLNNTLKENNRESTTDDLGKIWAEPGDKGKSKKSNSAPIEPAYNSPAFLMWWENLCKEPKWRYKSKQALTMAMNKLAKMTEQEAIVAMKKAIEMSYQGVFRPTERDMEEAVRTSRQEGIYISDLMKNEKNRT